MAYCFGCLACLLNPLFSLKVISFFNTFTGVTRFANCLFCSLNFMQREDHDLTFIELGGALIFCHSKT